MRRTLAALLLAASAAAAWSQASVTIADLNRDPARWHQKDVRVTGKTGQIKPKTSKAGRDYTVFPLYGEAYGDKVSVFTWGHPALAQGQKVTVTGTFVKEKTVGPYTFTNEIEAEEIRP